MEISKKTTLSRPSQSKLNRNDNKISIKLYIYIVTLAALLTTVGVLWDISWHASIGRDKFLTPPHTFIYLGAILGGLFSGIQVLLNTFKSTPEIRGSFVKIWGIFYSSQGALFCIWGAIAMLTSAPFDNWWHSAYGLDVTLLSPPHALVAVGVFSLQFGACVYIIKCINLTDPENKSLPVLQFLLIIAASCLLCMVCTYGSAFLNPRSMRTAFFYQAAVIIILMLLPAFGRALRMKWGITAIAFGYFLIVALINWTLQLFPAEPKIGPILTHITHFQPTNFPLLIMIPAMLMDLVLQKSTTNDWVKAALLTAIFTVVFLAIQYPLSGFLVQSPLSRNWFFGAGAWSFKSPPDAPFRYKFSPKDIQPLSSFAEGIGIALILGLFISRISLRWGKWMLDIQR